MVAHVTLSLVSYTERGKHLFGNRSDCSRCCICVLKQPPLDTWRRWYFPVTPLCSLLLTFPQCSSYSFTVYFSIILVTVTDCQIFNLVWNDQSQLHYPVNMIYCCHYCYCWKISYTDFAVRVRLSVPNNITVHLITIRCLNCFFSQLLNTLVRKPRPERD